MYMSFRVILSSIARYRKALDMLEYCYTDLQVTTHSQGHNRAAKVEAQRLCCSLLLLFSRWLFRLFRYMRLKEQIIPRFDHTLVLHDGERDAIHNLLDIDHVGHAGLLFGCWAYQPIWSNPIF